MDYRFVDSFYKEAHALGIEHSYDRVAIAGDIKNVVRPSKPGDAELILRQIEISKELHDIEEVVIISHQNCGAYGELAGLSADQELSVHTQDLLAAREIIISRVPGIRVLIFFATLKEGDHNNIMALKKLLHDSTSGNTRSTYQQAVV
ncbi:MAG: hypothetical protein CO132_05445 [Candidatus Kerfeldbacteria bacterium CG_4_9_14_3_um_filter_45_8]|nr:MAG: hypothetical protein CO132_05445 [Candidatus Kerfeldbacteria bacterium CG_4_9_14_3_um_filter_45_8]